MQTFSSTAKSAAAMRPGCGAVAEATGPCSGADMRDAALAAAAAAMDANDTGAGMAPC